MDVSLDGSTIVVRATGVELLKLKSALASLLGDKFSSTRDSLSFSARDLPIVSHLLPSGQISDEIGALIESFRVHSVARERAYQILDGNICDSLIAPWDSVLDPPQAVAVSALTTSGLLGGCLFDEQGSGKTIMAIAAYDTLRDKGLVGSMIVVCPKSMLEEWRNDIERFLFNKYKVIVGAGTPHERHSMALEPFDVLVLNYESVEELRVVLAGRAETLKYLLVIDESFYLKNANAVRSEAVGKLRDHCERCFVLCGTPAPNNAYDLINQFDLADLGFTFSSFRKTRDLVADRDAISTLIDARGMYIRRLKTEILSNVPDKNFHIINVKLSGRQALLYDEARSSLELELKSFDNVTFKKSLATYFQKRLALLQICASPNSIDGMSSDDPVKLTALDKLLESLISKGRKVIVWSFFRSNLDELSNRYKHYNPVRIDGSINSSTARREAVSSFQNDLTVKLFIGNPAAAGAGITLHASYDAVYVSYSNQAAHYLQSLDRIHRRGQVAAEVNYYLITCEGTIEETEVKRLRQKELEQHSILGDTISWPTSLDEALDELRGHGS